MHFVHFNYYCNTLDTATYIGQHVKLRYSLLTSLNTNVHNSFYELYIIALMMAILGRNKFHESSTLNRLAVYDCSCILHYQLFAHHPESCFASFLCIKHLHTKRRLLYLKTQFVPRSKHFSSQL